MQVCREVDKEPGPFEFASLSRQLPDPRAQSRAWDLLAAFKATEPRECPDFWYSQLEDLYNVAGLLADTESQQHARAVNDGVREASRKSVRLVRSAEQRSDVGRELVAMEGAWPLGRAEVVRPGMSHRTPACDVAEVFLQAGPTLRRRLEAAGYKLQSSAIGRQGAVPSPARLLAIKGRCLAELADATAFVAAASRREGADVVARFKSAIHREFDLDFFCTRGSDSVSISDLYTSLPMILERRQRESDGLQRELQARFVAFRADLGAMCSPLEAYMPIYEAIFELFRCVDNQTIEEHGTTVIAMFRVMFSTVLDLLTLSADLPRRSLGASWGPVASAVGVAAAEAMELTSVGRVEPMAAFLGGSLACAIAIQGLACLADYCREHQRRRKHGSHAKIRTVFRRNTEGAWRVWIIEFSSAASSSL